MSTTPMKPSPPELAPPAAERLVEAARPTREELLSARIRRYTLRRRILMATDALAAADLLLGVNSSLGGLGREEER